MMRVFLRLPGILQVPQKRLISWEAINSHKLILFNEEKQRQQGEPAVGDRIKVSVESNKKESGKLLMKSSFSTPHHCALHMNESLAQDSAVALVNGKPWDMHRPLIEDCSLKFVDFKDSGKFIVAANEAFWRTGSFLLGYALSQSLVEDDPPLLVGGKLIDGHIGHCFSYDVILDESFSEWTPSPRETGKLSHSVFGICHKGSKIEPLVVSKNVAQQIFVHNETKMSIIDQIDSEEIHLYKVLNHIDISMGPLISHLGLIGRFTVTSGHHLPFKNKFWSKSSSSLFRLQGVALPSQLPLHSSAYEIVKTNSAKFDLDDPNWFIGNHLRSYTDLHFSELEEPVKEDNEGYIFQGDM